MHKGLLRCAQLNIKSMPLRLVLCINIMDLGYAQKIEQT